MVRGFPKVGKQLMAVQKALQEGRLDLEREGAAFLKEQWEVLEHTAVDLETDVQILKFVLAQVIKPLAEKRAERFLPLPGGLQWLKGYCPICGSWPAVGFLRGEEGRRFLKCSFCGHEWQFVRTACPFCENNDPGSLELFYAEDRMWERLEVCHRCKRYLVAIDLRDRLEDVVMEVAPLGLVYLDIIAQEKGFRPGAVTEWNIIDDSRLASDDGEYSDAFS
jgi:FdhE protein